MKDEDRINIGDMVQVDINTAQVTLCYRAGVLHIPCATGDSWIFKKAEEHNPADRTIFYVSEGCTIIKNGRAWQQREDSLKKDDSIFGKLFG